MPTVDPSRPDATGSTPPDAGDRAPGDGRRAPLDRPPGARYERAGPHSEGADPATARTLPGLAVAALTGLAGSVLIVVLGGVLSLSAGLLLLTGLVGWVIGRSAATATHIGSGARRLIAGGLTIASVVVGQVGLWLYAMSQGGALDLVGYLAQTWGPLVPAQILVAAGAAWWASRG